MADLNFPSSTSTASTIPDPPATVSVLVFSKTAPSGYRHASIEPAVESLKRRAARSAGRFSVHATEDSAVMTPESLARFAVVLFLHNIDDFLSPEELDALRGYVRAGRGFVGVHSASAGLYGDEWYGRLVGAHFDFHPPDQWGVVIEEDSGHYILSGGTGRLAAEQQAEQGLAQKSPIIRRWKDEWYNFRSNPRGKVHVLLSAQEGSYEGGKGYDHPLAWVHEFEGARCFYTSLGHFAEAFEDEWFAGQIERGILWTARAV